MADNQEPPFEIPQDGKILLPHIVDAYAKIKPDQVHAEYPVSCLTYKTGYRKITFGDLANAVNGIAWWLQKTLGPGNFEKLAYIGPNDLRYPVLVLGAIKAGYVIFLLSTRNSVPAQLSLLEKLNCNIMLVTTPRLPPVTLILEAVDLCTVRVPTVEDLLDVKYPQFFYSKTYEDAFLEPIFAVHTSGSTGLPKPIIYTHETGARNLAMMMLDPPEDYVTQVSLYTGKRVFITFPPFHGAYLDIYLFNAIPLGTVMIIPTSGPVSAVGIIEAHKKSLADIAFVVPSIVQELAQDSELLDYVVQKLEMIIYSGGDLPQSIGDMVASRIKLINLYGSLELGIITLIHRQTWNPEDWKYIGFHPDIGAKLLHTSDGIYALYIVHNSTQKSQQPTSSLFPNTAEFSTKDLFLRHPEKTDLWKWYARADDIIQFLNGEKTNPISMEQHIVTRNSDIVRNVLVMGSHRFQAALLIDPIIPLNVDPSDMGSPYRHSKAEADLIDKIWPSINEANWDCPTHAKISKSHIFFTKAEKKILIAGKGTVQRAGTLALYRDELEALYNDADTDFKLENGGTYSNNCGSKVTAILRAVVTTVTNWRDISDQEDFFTKGMDSLQALMIMRELQVRFATLSIVIGTIYKSPSISQLANVIRQLSSQEEILEISLETRYQIRHKFFEKYRLKIDEIANRQSKLISAAVAENSIPGQQVVILTGSTGALGSYILDQLLWNPEISHIYCLNRSPQSLQIERNRARNLPAEFPASRVTFLTTSDFSAPNLGLQLHVYNELSSTVTLIIHNAWPVNFNLSLPSFEPHLHGLTNLLGLLASSSILRSNDPCQKFNVKLLFISSIASVMYYRSPSSKTPESVIRDDIAPGSHGYAESKYISELLLEYASDKLTSINIAFARVGQIAGAVGSKGFWLRDEWFPALAISSLYLGVFPKDLGPVMGIIDWIPIDLLAGILTELALGRESQSNKNIGILNENGVGVNMLAELLSSPSLSNSVGKLQVFHLVNPYSTTWKAICPIFVNTLSKLGGKEIAMIESNIWIEEVRNDIKVSFEQMQKEGELEAVLRRNPAFKLLDFYNNILETKGEFANRFETTETCIKSVKLRKLEGVNAEWVRKWAEQIYVLI